MFLSTSTTMETKGITIPLKMISLKVMFSCLDLKFLLIRTKLMIEQEAQKKRNFTQSKGQVWIPLEDLIQWTPRIRTLLIKLKWTIMWLNAMEEWIILLVASIFWGQVILRKIHAPTLWLRILTSQSWTILNLA